MRKRLRQQKRAREARLLDLGALVYELHRQGKRAPELLQQKAAELSLIDDEVRQLEASLDAMGLEPEEAEEASPAEPEAEEPEEAPEPEQPTQDADALEADPLQPHQAEEHA